MNTARFLPQALLLAPLKVAMLLTLLLGASSGLAQDEMPLRPTEAFRYAAVDTGSAIEIDWAIEDGYYLYRKELEFVSISPNVRFGEVELPPGVEHEDEFFGRQQVFRNRFFVSVPYEVVGAAPAAVDLQIRSRGCADLGICYPPQTWDAEVPLTVSQAARPAFSLTGSSGSSEFLPVDEAFRLYVEPVDGNTIEVAFQVTPAHYLYKDKIAVSTDAANAQTGQPQMPDGEQKFDEFFGEMEVYHEDVIIPVPVARATPEAMNLDVTVRYQGCADAGLCYPPQTRNFTVALPAATAVAALPAKPAAGARPVSEQGMLAEVITGRGLLSVIGIFFVSGLLLAFTPCVLPMVPILSGIIAGEGDDVSSSRGFGLALSYVMGMAIVYTAAGVAAAAVGVQLQAIFNAPWVLTVFAGLFVVLALSMFGLFDLQMPSALQSRLANVSGQQKSGTVIGAFVMGALSSLIVTACVAPPLVAALTVIGQTGDMLRGGAALFAMSMGMGAPLLLVGASAGKLLPKAGPWMVAVKGAFGFLMLGLAIWMLSRILPGAVTLALWGVLVLMAGVYLGGLTTLTAEAHGTQNSARALA